MTRGKPQISRLPALLALGLALAVVALAVLPHSWHDSQSRPCVFCQTGGVPMDAASAGVAIHPPGESARYVAVESPLGVSEDAVAESPARAPPA